MTPTIVTTRLKLREPLHEDAAAIAQMMNDLDYARMTSSVPHPYHEYFANGWISCMSGRRRRGEGLEWVVCTRDTGLPIGVIGVFIRRGASHWEIGYGFGKPFWGQGYATEAAKAVLDWAQETLGVTEVHAGHFADNPASGRILEKLGFARVGDPVPMWSLARGEKSPGLRYVWPAARAAEIQSSRLH